MTLDRDHWVEPSEGLFEVWKATLSKMVPMQLDCEAVVIIELLNHNQRRNVVEEEITWKGYRSYRPSDTTKTCDAEWTPHSELCLARPHLDGAVDGSREEAPSGDG